MSVTAAGSASEGRRTTGIDRLVHRQLESYPDTGPRTLFLAVTVLATIMLYYELYVAGSVSTLILPSLHMSFTFFVTTLAFGNLIGAFGSLFAGITDRLGRCNLVVVGLLITGVMTAFVLPAATSKWAFTIEGFAVGLVEGICLVATPALIRDFSPQVGRATAMGFWTCGPVVGSLVVAVVGSNTINATTQWPHEYRICGIAGLVVFVICAIGMRELSPGLRDQLMVSTRDRALIEARAKGLDIEASLRNPFGQLLKADVLISALGVSLMLLVYYTAVGFSVIYLSTIFGFTLKDANGLGNWNWGFNVIAVVLIGLISDKLRVRKPLMVIGGVGAIVMLIIYLLQAGHHPSYYTLALMLALLSFFLGVAYCPWMASFTETVEARNPALTATGLAIWGWIIRVVVFVSYLVLPVVVTSVTPLVNYGTAVQTAAKQYAPSVAFAQTHPQVVATAQQIAPELLLVGAHAQLFTQLAANPTPALIQQAVAAVGPAEFAKIAADRAKIASVLPFVPQLTQLQAAAKDPNFQVLEKHGAAVVKAAKDAPSQWKTWYWICVAGIVVFLLAIPLLRGRWSPKAARADEDAHEAWVQAEMAKLNA